MEQTAVVDAVDTATNFDREMFDAERSQVVSSSAGRRIDGPIRPNTRGEISGGGAQLLRALSKLGWTVFGATLRAFF